MKRQGGKAAPPAVPHITTDRQVWGRLAASRRRDSGMVSSKGAFDSSKPHRYPRNWQTLRPAATGATDNTTHKATNLPPIRQEGLSLTLLQSLG